MIIQNLSLTFDLQIIFQNINLSVDESDKVGITGVNGAGKTTLFNVLLSNLEPDEGTIIWKKNTRIAYLPQVITDDEQGLEKSAFDYLKEGRPIAKYEAELTACYEELANGLDEKKEKIVLNQISKLQGLLDYWDCYEAENILLKIVMGMNIDIDMLDKKMSELSGGQKSKLAFAKLLYQKPEVILLDEPTNHLDAESRTFIMEYLKTYKGMVLVISHDIDFLNEVTNKTLFIDKRTHKMRLYNGNYAHFKKILMDEEENLLKLIEAQEREVSKLRSVVLLYSNSSGKRKRMAQDREKKLEKLESKRITLPPKQKVTKLKLTSAKKGSLSTVKVENLTFGYNEDHVLIHDLTFEIYRNERFLIVGNNGVGKSTLLKLIMNILTPNEGKITLGNNVDIAYYAQEHEGLNLEGTILENFSEFQLSDKEVRNVLGNFLFYGDDAYKRVKVLSPGERSRVALARLVLKRANFLILDEPTNHLDPETQNIIAETFKNYEGTILVVSHNPEFVSNIGIERLLHLPKGEITYYDRHLVEHYQKENT